MKKPDFLIQSHIKIEMKSLFDPDSQAIFLLRDRKFNIYKIPILQVLKIDCVPILLFLVTQEK